MGAYLVTKDSILATNYGENNNNNNNNGPHLAQSGARFRFPHAFGVSPWLLWFERC